MAVDWSRDRIAWAAGLFEGEGCISLKPRSIQMSLGMTDEDVVRKFGEICGLGKVYGPYQNKQKPTSKPMWVWAASGHRNCQAIIAAFWGFLGNRRRDTSQRALSCCAKMEPHGSVKSHCKRGHKLDGDNLYTHNGKRFCRTCRLMHSKSSKLRKREDGNPNL